MAEIYAFTKVMSQKHRRCYQIMKYLSEPRGLVDLPNYHIKTVVLRDHPTCSDTTDDCYDCVMALFGDLLLAYKTMELLSYQSNFNILNSDNSHSCELYITRLCSVSVMDSWKTFINEFYIVESVLMRYVLIRKPFPWVRSMSFSNYAGFHCQCNFIKSRVMRKPALCICKNKDADQFRGNREADQRLCFRYIGSAIPLLPKSEISSLKPSSMAVQLGLCQTWLETPKTGFLTTRLVYLSCFLNTQMSRVAKKIGVFDKARHENTRVVI